MNKPRKKIELLKAQLRSQLETDTQRYKRAVVREIDYQWRKLNKNNPIPSFSDFLGEKFEEAKSKGVLKGGIIEGKNFSIDTRKEYDKLYTEKLKQLQDDVLKKLRIPPESRKALAEEITSTQKDIAKVWDDYFREVIFNEEKIIVTPGDFEKMLSANKVDFPALEESLRDKLTSQFTQSIRQDYSFEKLRSNLLKNDLGEWQAYTEANTAIAQFDNAYHVENALQAGVEKFIWDGPPTLENSHDLCIMNVGKEFTLEELQAMDNGTDLPVETSLGGYNCRHYLTAVIDK